MIRNQNADQEPHLVGHKCPKEIVSESQKHQNASRNTPTIEDDSEGELYGLALILRNTEEAAASKRHDSYSSSETSNNKDSKKEEVTPALSEIEDDKVSLWCFPRLNRRLVIYKSFYFFFFSAIGSLFPYLAVFYKQLWLSAHETGILIGIRPLIQLFGTPMWGIIADTYKKSKVIFIMSLVAWLVSNYSLSLVSPVFHLGACKDNATMGIVQEIIKVLENGTVPVKNSTSTTRQKQKAPVSVNSGKSSEHWFEIVGKVKENNSSKRATSILQRPRSQNQLQSLHPAEDFLNMSSNTKNNFEVYTKSRRKSGDKNHPLSKSRTLHRLDISRHRRHIESPQPSTSGVNISLLNSLDKNLTKRDKQRHNKLPRSDVKNKVVIFRSDLLRLFHNSSEVNTEEFASQVNRELIERKFDSLNLAGEYPWPLDTVANYDFTQASYDWHNPHDAHLFTILFVITAVGTLIAAPAITLADTATLHHLGNRPEDYGKQRLWGAFGWGLAAFIVGSSLSTIEELNNCNNPLSVDYLPCFYAFACLMGVALLIGALFEFDDKESEETHIWQGLAILIDCQYIYFILTILFCGIALGFIQTFLFWHLEDLGGSQFLFSTITAIHCISEVTVYSFSGLFIKWFGHHQVLYVGLTCYIIRFFGYAFITNSWIVLPFEILHGLSTAAVWSAAVVFVGLIPGAPATMQGILGGVHWGLGNGGGGVVGGLLITYAGTTTSFLIFGVVSLLDLSFFICLNNMKYFNCFHWSKEDSTRTQYTLQEDKVDENDEDDYDDLY